MKHFNLNQIYYFMKLNKILMALAATAVVGCTSDDLNEFSTKQAAEDSRLVELNENFVLAGVGEGGSMTRTHWEQDATTGALVNKFLPIYTSGATFSSTLDADADLDEQTVGLCWLGQGAVGTDVYTNYQFYHFGWLNNDETEADIDACGTLYNGSLYDEITMTTGTVSAEAIPGTDWVVAGLPAKSVKAGADNLNYNSGVYRTENKSIFGGDYIVYYPFDENFKEAGTIPAAAVTNWTDVPTDWQSAEIGKATFRYSAPVTIEGGYQAANFGLYNLSSIAQLRVSTVAGDACIGDNIDQIVLYSASQKLLKKAYLAADKIVAGAKGADLYADTEGTKTIVATLATAPIALAVTPAASAYITVLPTTVDDLVALVHNSTDGTWAQVDMANTVFPAGSAKRYDIVVKAADFTSDYIAVDDASLAASLTSARADVTADPTATPTITVIGDITLSSTANQTINTTQDANITITGDDIIVPEDFYLYLNTNLESDVRVLGKSCCTGTSGGRVYIQGGTINNVTMEPTEARVTDATYDVLNPMVTYSAGTATIAAGKTFDVQAGNVVVNATVEHKGNIKIAEDAKVTVNATGDLQFMGSNVTNNGTIEVMKNGKFDMTDANGNATATDGQRMTNNGKFIHNVDAGVGTAVQSMKQNGEYRCRVNEQIKLDDAFLQWTACSVIEIVDHASTAQSYNLGTAAGVAYKHNNKYIDIEVNTPSNGVTTFTNPGINTAGDGDGKTIEVGNLTVTAGGLDIVYKATTTTGRRTLKVHGDMTVAANTTITSSQKIFIDEDLNVEGTGITLTYKGAKANVDGLAVTKDVNVSGATFDAGSAAADVDALNITCANFYLEKGATATFGNRTDGAAKNLVVSGTISNPEGCTFNIVAANQNSAGSVLAWVTCKKLEVGGTFSAARPRVE